MMAIRDHAAASTEVGEGTLVELFSDAIERFGSRPALRSRKRAGWADMSYQDVASQVQEVAAALRSLGINRGDRVAILSDNRPEWALADYGCLCAGIIDVPIYATLTSPQIRYILGDSGARLVFVSDTDQLDKVEQVREECGSLEWVVVFDPPGALPPQTIGWEEFLKRAPAPDEAVSLFESAERTKEARPEDVATILYTSGTTGDPKGVMLTHNNLYWNVRTCSQLLPIDDRDSTLSFLPLSHVFQRMVDYLFFSVGCSIAYARSLQLVTEDLKEIQPTLVVSVPRLYEKVYTAVTDAEGLKRVVVEWAVAVGARWADAKLGGRKPGIWTRVAYSLADRILFRKIRAAVGGRLRYFVSGGAPLSPEINRFFFSSGITILEGYGLTETSPVTNVNSPRNFPENYRIGTVGKPIPGTEQRIAEDGEILVRGPQVMKGYFRLPERTARAISPDGWFHTGDIGEFDRDGFLRITDRKKDIIVTAGGKNVAPQPIENELKKNRYLDQPVLIGDRRKFIVLLVAPAFEALESWARARGLAATHRRELLQHSQVQELIAREAFSALRHLSRVETPKKILLLDQGFTVEDGSLTPTQKVKRHIVESRYQSRIDALYAKENDERTVFTAW